MTINPTFSDAQPVAPDFLDDVRAGLSRPQKALSPKYFYDAAGSDLFEKITRLPEYYPTRTEIGILDGRGPEIAALLPAGAALVEFGSGSTVKLRRLLRHLDKLAAYVPVDVSGEFLCAQAETLSADFPHLRVEPVVADFTRDFDLPENLAGLPRAGFFPGSTIGNFEPEEAEALLARFGRILGSGAHMIVGVDLVKDAATLETAYDDAEGVTAAFNLNLLTRINRELAGRFDLDAFAHRAVFNRQASRIEMHLVARDAQDVAVGSDTFAFAAGETIHTESSYKYTVETFRALAERAGWRWIQVWTDADGLFSVHALRLD
ncbi:MULTISPECIES: L-histidine N(alpha)-methyltransferase [unclassified Methylobacterium]|uniref:L-histidine N(alpha)-methyltransferase n=1 Tax=unclassified Methylobacterium TaxID=2615210 RepID=UPI0013543F93|nr:L-histidine N(alpha)-methyltransferase [Methylobacterium sp. 2A]MWV25936.1 L-histidine N(alpha)-methyltransferase [Methylobacterium sp. 2A]